jgi:hypothetical protein
VRFPERRLQQLPIQHPMQTWDIHHRLPTAYLLELLVGPSGVD